MRILTVALPLLLLLFACTPTTEREPSQEPRLQDAGPDSAPRETAQPRESASPDTAEQPLERAPERPTSPPEKSLERTPEPTAPDKGSSLSAGPCKSSSPKCPAGFRCRDDGKPPTCQRRCDPDKPSSDCPGGKPCLVLGTGEGICVEGSRAKSGEKCDLSNICEQGLVCVLSGESGTCYQRCTVRNQSCPQGRYCFLLHSFNGVCIQGSGGTKAPGEACKRSTECKAGTICFAPYQRSSRCSELCDANRPCKSGYTCADIQGATRGTGACVN